MSVASEGIQRLRALCAQTQHNLDYVRRSSCGARSAAQAVQHPQAAFAAAKENSSASPATEHLLASEVARLRQRVEELAAALEAAERDGPRAEVESCVRQVEALWGQQASLERRLQSQLSGVRQQCAAVSGGDGFQRQLIDELRSSLRAREDAAAAQQGQQAAEMAALAQRVEGLAAQLGGAPAGGWQAQQTAALARVEAALGELSAAQEAHAAQLLELQQEQGGQGQAADACAGGGVEQAQEQLRGMQQSLDELAQAVFELRVEMQNSAEDTGIELASAKRQAAETQQQVEGLAARVGEAEADVQALWQQLAAAGESATAAAGGAAASAQPPQELVDWLRAWLQEELMGITQAQESQEGRLQELTVQLAGLAPLPASAAAVQAQVECLSQQQEQHAASVAAASARLEGQLAQQGKTLVALAEQVGTPQEQATQPVLAAVEQRIASLELSSQNVESAAAAAAEQLAGQLASTQQQLADAQRAAVERAAAAGASLQELSAQVDALAQAQAPAEAVEALQRGLRDVQLGLELCCGSFAQTKQGLEARVGRLEAAVAGALEEVAGQMNALQGNVAALESRAVAAASTQQASQQQQHAAAAPARFPELQLPLGRLGPSRSSSMGEQSGRLSARGRRSSGLAETSGAAAGAEPPLPSPRQELGGEEKSLRELFGAGVGPSRQSTTSGPEELLEQVRQLECALAGSELDELQREIFVQDLADLQRQLAEQ